MIIKFSYFSKVNKVSFRLKDLNLLYVREQSANEATQFHLSPGKFLLSASVEKQQLTSSSVT